MLDRQFKHTTDRAADGAAVGHHHCQSVVGDRSENLVETFDGTVGDLNPRFTAASAHVVTGHPRQIPRIRFEVVGVHPLPLPRIRFAKAFGQLNVEPCQGREFCGSL